MAPDPQVPSPLVGEACPDPFDYAQDRLVEGVRMRGPLECGFRIVVCDWRRKNSSIRNPHSVIRNRMPPHGHYAASQTRLRESTSLSLSTSVRFCE